MATVIRSPQLNKKPRKLHGAETVETRNQPEGVPAERMEIRESSEHYSAPESQVAADTAAVEQPVAAPVITEEDVAELQRRLELAESSAAAAEQELAAMRSDLEALRVKASAEGYAAGREESNNKLDAEYSQKLQSVQAVLQAMSGQLEQLVAHAEDSIVETVYAAIVKIIGERLATPDNILAVVKHVSAQLVRPENFTVRLAPADYELITAARVQIAADGDEAAALRIVSDSRIELGGCILESAAGSLDARLEVQLQRLKDVLLDSRARRQSELQGKK